MKDFRNRYASNPCFKQKAIESAEAWAKWLPSFNWTYFITMNTRFEMSLKSTRRAMGRFFNMLPWPKTMFWVAEVNPGRDGYHSHGLLKTYQTVESIKEIWQITSGAKRHEDSAYLLAKKYKQGKGAAQYCSSKLLYLYKDYDLFDNE